MESLFPETDPKSPEPVAGLIRFGTSSFSTPDWVGAFYPRGTRPADFLRYYATQFNTVEVDATYYGVPPSSAIEKWRRVTPENFLISAKFPREIVHGGRGRVPDRDVLLSKEVLPIRDEFVEVMRGLGPRLGPLLLQFPFFSKDVFPAAAEFWDRLDRFLNSMPKDIQVAVEVRNSELVNATASEICRSHGAGLVMVDQAWMPHGDEIPADVDPVTASFAYIRLLGDHKEMDKLTRTWEKEVVDRSPRLARWAEFLAAMLEREVPVLVYANNHYSGHAPATLRTLMTMVKRALSDKTDDRLW